MSYLIDMDIVRNDAGEICGIDGVRVMDISEWMELFYGKEGDEIPLEKTCNDLREWCHKNKAVYYGAPKRNFFLREGFEIAKKEGKSTVIVEYL